MDPFTLFFQNNSGKINYLNLNYSFKFCLLSFQTQFYWSQQRWSAMYNYIWNNVKRNLPLCVIFFLFQRKSIDQPSETKYSLDQKQHAI